MKQLTATVIANDEVAGPLLRRHIIKSQVIRLACPGLDPSRPGQFVMVKCGDNYLPRPFSVHRVNDKGKICLYFAVLENGAGTQWLAERQPGDKVETLGPLGNGFSINPGSRNLLLIAGGMGVAPLFYLAEAAQKSGLSVDLLYGAATKNSYIEGLCTASGIKLVEATEDGAAGYHGLITDKVPAYINQADQVFACGPMPMYRTLAQMPQLKDKPVQVSLEVRMACGAGVCLGCTIRTRQGLKQVCQDGPVFDLRDIMLDEVKC